MSTPEWLAHLYRDVLNVCSGSERGVRDRYTRDNSAQQLYIIHIQPCIQVNEREIKVELMEYIVYTTKFFFPSRTNMHRKHEWI